MFSSYFLFVIKIVLVVLFFDTNMLQTIDLYATDEWFIANKSMVYSTQTYGLCQTNLWFTSSKAIVYAFKMTCF